MVPKRDNQNTRILKVLVFFIFMQRSEIMPKIIDPKETTRASAYELWMKAPNPMVTFFKTLDVTNLVRVSK